MAKPIDREREKLWGRALVDGLRYALHLTHNKAHAEVLAADAVAAALDPDRSPWDPESGKTASQHVVYLVRMGLKNEAAKKRLHNDPVRAGAVDDRMRRPVPRPDARIMAEERREREQARWQAIRQGLDPFEQRALDGFREGVTPAEQARRLSVDASQIYEARRKIANRIRALPIENDGHDGDAADAYLRERDDDQDGEDEVIP